MEETARKVFFWNTKSGGPKGIMTITYHLVHRCSAQKAWIFRLCAGYGFGYVRAAGLCEHTEWIRICSLRMQGYGIYAMNLQKLSQHGRKRRKKDGKKETGIIAGS